MYFVSYVIVLIVLKQNKWIIWVCLYAYIQDGGRLLYSTVQCKRLVPWQLNSSTTRERVKMSNIFGSVVFFEIAAAEKRAHDLRSILVKLLP